LDDDGISFVAAKCIFDAMGFNSEAFNLVLPQNIADAPVVWTITHNAAFTEDIISFIEEGIGGVKFLCQLQRADISLQDCDASMNRIIGGLCIHPLAINNEDEDAKGDHDNSAALLGLDLDMLAQSLRMSDKDPSWSVLLPPSHFLSFVRPWEERYLVFIGGLESSRKLMDSYMCSNLADEKGTGHFDDGPKAMRRTLMGAAPVDYQSTGVKIVDLGNACWTFKHFTDDIQTRQYRSPEVILGADYDTSADMWSAACIVFELLVGDLMFDPRAGKSWDRDEDHLAMIMELLGKFPKSVSSKGSRCTTYFNKNGDLKHINQLKFWGLRDVLFEKYKFSESDAEEITSFLLPILEV
jgi:hypothetical protein